MTNHSRRYNLVFGLLLLAMAALCVRLVLLVRDGHGPAVSRAETQQRRVMRLPGRPGGIFARSRRRYVPLAISRQVPSCFVDPSLLADDELDDVALALGRALSMDPLDIQQELFRRRDKRFAWIKRQITDAETNAVGALKFRAVGIQLEWRREYPNEELAATVVGFRRVDGVAGGGLELSLDSHLAAVDGRRVVLVDAARRPIWPLAGESSLPRDGADVFLHLDAVVQGYLQQAVAESVQKFSAKWGTGVVVDPQTGRVLAMCSLPTFNPNSYNIATPAELTNRAISVPFEPGSVLKPIIAAGAVETGTVTYQTEIFCENGSYYAKRGGRITDHGASYGDLTVADGVVHSSNICMAKVGERLGNETLYRIARRFGLGEDVGIQLPGRSIGIVRPLAKWDTYSLRRVPFGQEISTSALQLTMAFSALANGGLLLQPRLIDRITNCDGNTVYSETRQVVRRVLSPSVAAQTLAVMQQVVERGTGKACRLDDWTSFGKTGTAQIAGVGGYVDGAFTGSFVGGAPVNRPRVVCLISIYWPDKSKGHYGATVAGPYVKDVLEQTLAYLAVPPDRMSAWSAASPLAMGQP